jgi:hypothetical protein
MLHLFDFYLNMSAQIHIHPYTHIPQILLFINLRDLMKLELKENLFLHHLNNLFLIKFLSLDNILKCYAFNVICKDSSRLSNGSVDRRRL